MVSKIDVKIKELESQIEDLKNKQAKELRNSTIKCIKCAKRKKITSLKLCVYKFVSDDCPYSGKKYGYSRKRSYLLCSCGQLNDVPLKIWDNRSWLFD